MDGLLDPFLKPGLSHNLHKRTPITALYRPCTSSKRSLPIPSLLEDFTKQVSDASSNPTSFGKIVNEKLSRRDDPASSYLDMCQGEQLFTQTNQRVVDRYTGRYSCGKGRDRLSPPLSHP